MKREDRPTETGRLASSDYVRYAHDIVGGKEAPTLQVDVRPSVANRTN